MEQVRGEATGPAGTKKAMLNEALQAALDNAPPPQKGTDVQSFRLASVELQYGGFVLNTITRVTLEVQDGPLP